MTPAHSTETGVIRATRPRKPAGARRARGRVAASALARQMLSGVEWGASEGQLAELAAQIEHAPELRACAEALAVRSRRAAAELQDLCRQKPELRGWWLTPIPPASRADALREAESGGDWCCYASNMHSLDLVHRNADRLLALGRYERDLLDAYTAPRLNTAHVSAAKLSRMFARADRARLRAAGDRLPRGDRFTLYRGVAGDGRLRREAGYSWTRCPRRAAWFAVRAASWGLANPAVLVTEARAEDVLAYVHEGGRNEDDFLYLATGWRWVDPMPEPAK